MERATDFERFRAILSSANIGAIQEIKSDRFGTEVVIKNTGRSGYRGFYSTWNFDPDGNLTEIAHWEGL